MVTILDGGMGGEIQKHLEGANHGLWSAKALIEAPDLVRSIHQAYVDQGHFPQFRIENSPAVDAGGVTRNVISQLIGRLIQLEIGRAHV